MKGFKFHEMSFRHLISFLLWCGASIISLHESDAIHMLSYPYVSWKNPICLYLSISYWEWLFCNVHVPVWKLTYALSEWIWRPENKFGCSLLVVISFVCLFIYSVRASHQAGIYSSLCWLISSMDLATCLSLFGCLTVGLCHCHHT